MLSKSLIALLLLVGSVAAQAAAIEKLKNFVGGTRAASAQFSQQVFDQAGKRLQNAQGGMLFQRPGKFRWTYQKPYEQLIVGDGNKFWLYDVDLQQVTVKKLDAALGSSPAALLSGNNEIERDFVLKELGARDGLEWLLATPKSGESQFAAIRLGFNAQSELVQMELDDTFGHKTRLQFSGMQRNPKIPEGSFRFTPPAGVDVLGE